MEYLQLYIVIIILSILFMVTPWIKQKKYVLFPSILLLATVNCIISIDVLLGNSLYITLNGSIITGEIKIVIDSLSAWFLLLISFTFVTGVMYGNKYMQAYNAPKSNTVLHWIFYILCFASISVVCVMQNMLVFLIAWEMMAISAFLLVIFEGSKIKAVKAGINYLIQSHIAIVFITIGFIWVYSSTQSFDFDAIGEFTKNAKPFRSFLLMMILFIGFGTKAGFFPLHTWLPIAHPEAPSHVSGVMSGVLVKIGIYGLFRSISFLHQDFQIFGVVILFISLITSFFGIINASIHRDFKKMLAYCTIENIGIIGIGIGIGLIGLEYNNQWLILLGFSGALLHTLNHSLVKSLLFYAAGSVYQQTHTRDMEKLGGIIKKMPTTAMFFLIGAIGIGGIPPLNGFISEFVIYSGLIRGLTLPSTFNIMFLISIIAGLAIIGGFSIFAFTKTFGVIFLGTARTKLHKEPEEVSEKMLLPQYFIVIAMLSVAFFPAFYFKLAAKAVTLCFANFNSVDSLQFDLYCDVLQSVGFFSFIFVLVIVIIYVIRWYFTTENVTKISSTWSCAYTSSKTNMQYTGKSFSKGIAKLLNFILPENKKYKELKEKEIFPNQRTHSTYYSDFFDYYVVDKILVLLNRFMNAFKFVQNGKLQRYILTGLFFILTIFLWFIIDLLNGIFK